MSNLDSRVDIFSCHGIDYVMSIVEEEVEWFFGEWPEDQGIGTSDVGACWRAVIDKLGSRPEKISELEGDLIMNAVRNVMSDVLARREYA